MSGEFKVDGQVVGGRYRLLDIIGQGGQGVVCRALDLATGSDVAVKIIEGKAARNPATIERMAREQQALIALAGTHAVGFLDMCKTDDGSLCLVMELLRGQEFEKHLVEVENQGERFSVERLIETLGPIAETLEKAHSVGIIHRDLKPGNIFLISPEAGGGARLLDFGFARLQNSRLVTRNGMVMGSPSYIAPEMWQGFGRRADHRVDVYAFGVIVYRALSGELPFSNASMQQILSAATSKPRPSLHRRRPDLPREVDRWVWKALAIEPDDRYPSVGACWDELLNFINVEEAPAVSRRGLTEPTADLDKIRTWIQEPPSDRNAEAQSVWATAAQALKRLIGRSKPAERSPSKRAPAAAPIVPMPTVRPTGKPPTTPPPLPAKQKAQGSLPAPDARKAARGTLVIPAARKPLPRADNAPPSIAELSSSELKPIDSMPFAELSSSELKPIDSVRFAETEPVSASKSEAVGDSAGVDDSAADRGSASPREHVEGGSTAESAPPDPPSATDEHNKRGKQPRPKSSKNGKPRPARVSAPARFDKPKWKSRRHRGRK